MRSFKKSLLTLPFWAVIFAFLVHSCTDPNSSTVPDTISVTISPTSAEIPPEGGSISINVSSNGTWKVTGDSWIKISHAAGDRNLTITASAEQNDTGAERSGKITVTTSTSSASVTVSQKYYNKYSDIADIRAMFKGDDVTIKDDLYIKGTVISNYRHSDNGGLNNNTSQKGIAISDQTGGIQLFCAANNTDFAFGDIVEVSLKGQKLSQYANLLQINGIPLDKITKLGQTSPVAKEITAEELCSGKYESQYVAVKDVQVASTDLGKTFSSGSSHTSINMISKEGTEFLLFTSKYASFKDQTVPSGSGTLKGVACIFYDSYQIILAKADDAAALTGPRFANGTEFSLASNSASIDGFADSLTFTLVSNVEWCAESSDENFTVYPNSGTPQGLETISIKVKYNDNPSTVSSRTATISIKSEEAATVNFIIVQEPYVNIASDPVPNWMELPAVTPETGFVYINHSYDYFGKTYRNFSLWYDYKNRYSTWAAYPLYQSSQSVSRTDSWDYDPKIPKRYQAEMFSAVSGYDRGHQVPSGDRLVSKEANEQTFYFTNITAQADAFNTGVWSTLEGKVREWAGACDTMYVVTGALAQYGDDRAINYCKDNSGRDFAIPKAYFKVLLRYNKDGQDNGGYDAIGFIFENKKYSSSALVPADAKSIDEMETLTGFDFFHNLPDDIETVVEKSLNTDNWKF